MNIIRRGITVFIATLIATASIGNGALADAAFDEGATSAEQQLLAMANALDQQSYQGTLTYEFGGPLETLAFEHLVQEQGTQERIRHLSGRPRDFSRKLPSNYCGNAAMRLFSEVGDTPFQRLGLHYNFQSAGENRVADRTVDIVKITPKDTHRYGFTLGIDRESHLPLMLTLTGERGQVLERFQFVQLTLGPVEQPTSVSDASQRLAFTKEACSTPKAWDGWKPQWLPAGFVPARVDATDEQAVMSFTDGLASISIFVSPIEDVSGAVGVVQRGATVAAMTMVALNQRSFKVSVVGEIPPAIARKVAASVAYQAAP